MHRSLTLSQSQLMNGGGKHTVAAAPQRLQSLMVVLHLHDIARCSRQHRHSSGDMKALRSHQMLISPQRTGRIVSKGMAGNANLPLYGPCLIRQSGFGTRSRTGRG